MKRKKRTAATVPRGVCRLNDVLPQLIAKYGLQQRHDVEHIESIWRDVVGDPFGPVTRVVGLSRGVLQVAVPHVAFVQELSFRLPELIEKLQRELPDEKIKKIKFLTSNTQ